MGFSISETLNLNELTFSHRDLAIIGDYAGCIWKCIKIAMRKRPNTRETAQMCRLVHVDLFWDKLSDELKNDPMNVPCGRVSVFLRNCLRDIATVNPEGPWITFEMAVFVIAVYTIRNKVFHRAFASEDPYENQRITRGDIQRFKWTTWVSPAHQTTVEDMMKMYSNGLIWRMSKDENLARKVREGRGN
ncbi:uncharacterized protein DSM5745_07584 [Aspergillus mulundensis]|uniref:Uncharacterized protein n=1 Tax=Aspergillus mulundensis TaxID=1810919 RepID=A0A3D8REE9_9EURO|nr:hypothetical protein DSM5745_07584 [Aspergillus mulundensis]RDW72412.1 hypothetical protein DSM5745_07584 [Aspergillus mulundensis]